MGTTGDDRTTSDEVRTAQNIATSAADAVGKRDRNRQGMVLVVSGRSAAAGERSCK